MGWELSGLAVCRHQTIWVIRFVFRDRLKEGEKKKESVLGRLNKCGFQLKVNWKIEPNYPR